MGLQRVTQRCGALLRRLALLVLALGLWSPAARAQFFSPGELARGHEQLEGDEHCSDCHSAGNRVAADKCLGCHEDVARSVRQKQGLHGRKFAGQPCGSCHVDHRGRDHELVRWDPKSFEHADTGWKLAGAHARSECAKCHTGKNERQQPTYIGLSNACAACHADKHQGRFGSACQGCHDVFAWHNLDLDPFDHDQARFDLRGKHQKVACARCHGEPPKYQPLAFQSCADCHQDPHGGRVGSDCDGCHVEDSWRHLDMPRSAHPGLSLQAGHAKVACKTCHDRGNLASPSRGKRCASCHTPVHVAKFGDDCADCHASIRWLGLPEAIGRRSHERTRYPLEGKHDAVECDECHSPKLPRARRFRRLEFDSCNDCHRDVHRGQFADRSGGECAACHTVDGFAAATFGVEQHASTRFALGGGHEAAPCATCHSGPRPRLDWQLQKQACSDCHENPHGDQFQKELREGGCGACHNSVAWDIPNIAHDTWPLTGAHAEARCEQCHTPTAEDRRAGTGVSYREAPRECEGCHADVHLGQFQLSDPKLACKDCHDSKTFKLPGFDHAARTGYALVGKHQSVNCRACHLPTELASGETTLLWRLPYRECKDCHRNPHVEERK